MRKFKVTKQETYKTYEEIVVEVEAENEVEAVLLAEEGYGRDIERFQQSSEFLGYTTPRDTWYIEEVK